MNFFNNNFTNDFINYLNNNYSQINLNNEDYSDLAILDKDLENKEIFLTGEVHGIKINADLHMKFLKYFKEKTDFKYYLSEVSYSNAYFFYRKAS